MKLRTLTKLAAGIVALALLAQSCATEEVKTEATYLDLPSTPDVYIEGGNNDLPTLGRVLFYDPQLSVNNTISCSSCHKQALAFADDVAFSKGFDNRLTTRNSMPIQNLGSTFFFGGVFLPGDDQIGNVDPNFSGQVSLFWDGREHDLKQMVLIPVLNHVEMGISDLDDLAAKLETVPYYKELFLKAYGTEEITPDRISEGLRMFILNINSRNTTFDVAQNFGTPLTALQQKGQQLFLETYDCNACHQIQNPQGYAIFGGGFANIGLDPEYQDDGVEHVTKNPLDAGKFKIPSLRNVELTAPYMHDGRFNTLEDVVEHYSLGIEDHPNLDERLRSGSGGPMQFNISEYEKEALVAFLGTLTDQTMLTDPKLSNPFKKK